MTEATPKENQSAAQKIAGSVGTLIGVAVGFYAGLNAVIPIVAAWLTHLLLKRTNRFSRNPFLLSTSVQSGHVLWMVSGILLLGDGLELVFLDVLVISFCVCWLLIRPGLSPVILLCLFQLFGFISTLIIFVNTDIGSYLHKALLVHLIFRAVAIGFMTIEYRHFRGEQTARELKDC